MNDRYLLIRRGQNLDESHNGTTRVANCFLWVQIVDSAHNEGKLEEPLNNSKPKSCTKKSVPDVPGFQKREKNLGSFAV